MRAEFQLPGISHPGKSSLCSEMTPSIVYHEIKVYTVSFNFNLISILQNSSNKTTEFLS